ncbi:MAG: putative DNA binding domain-containing protein [Bryobacterales bacterium]|nr:putative DNA binding domain-containing protein [Bryobacterales bacterium]
MKRLRFDPAGFLKQDEGQHFERKSMFEGPPGRKRPRDRRQVRDQVAECVAAFANAEGGVLILGIEDDGAVSGHSLPEPALRSVLKTPGARLNPRQPDGFLVPSGGEQLIVFDVTVSNTPVMVVGNGFPLRVGDQTVRVRETQIRALKRQNMYESWESRPSRFGLKDLDRRLLARARSRAGLADWTDEEYLLKRKLADRRGKGIVLRRAAELLFSRLGPDHPNAGIRVFRVIGRERKTGAEYNVEELPRIESHLPGVLDESRAVVEAILRRPSRMVDGRFRATSEYPGFSWREAVLNAVEHRDYGIEGAGTEIWLFENRMEVVSSGALVGGLALEEVLSLNRVHRTRNPRLVRVLVDLGYARDQGEGVPRMFAEMEDAFLPPPEIEAVGQSLKVTLRNTPNLTVGDREFLSSLESVELSRLELRALIQARRQGRVDNATMRSLSALGTLTASRLLRGLRDRGLLMLHSHEADSFYTLANPLPDRIVKPLFDTDRGELKAHRGELPLDVQVAIERLGVRPRKERVREVIQAICRTRDWTTSSQIAKLLHFRLRNLTSRHLGPMVDAGKLVRRFPDTPNHPAQAYRASHRGSERPPSDGTRSHAPPGSPKNHRGEPPPDRGEFAAHRGEPPPDRGELPRDVQVAIERLGVRPRKERVREVIQAICRTRDWTTPSRIAKLLHLRRRNLTSRHLGPMVDAGRLVRRYPDTPNHPAQAYRASHRRKGRPPSDGVRPEAPPGDLEKP